MDEQEKPPDIALNTMKILLNLAVGQAHFKCNDMWYTQKDGLSIGASIAVKLANLWMKDSEPVLSEEIPKIFDIRPEWPEMHGRNEFVFGAV